MISNIGPSVPGIISLLLDSDCCTNLAAYILFLLFIFAGGPCIKPQNCVINLHTVATDVGNSSLLRYVPSLSRFARVLNLFSSAYFRSMIAFDRSISSTISSLDKSFIVMPVISGDAKKKPPVSSTAVMLVLKHAR